MCLRGASLPDFTANRGVLVDVEAKRRNRTGKQEYNLEKEIRAIRQNIAKALEKKRSNPYLIFVDSDIPPKSSKENKIFHERCRKEFEAYDLDKTAIVITNSEIGR